MLLAEKKFIQNRSGSNDDDPDDDDLEMFLQVKVKLHQNKFLQVVPGKEHRKDPGYTADEIIEPEFSLVHGHDTGDDRRKGPDNGEEAGEDDGLAAMFFIELFGLIKIFFLEQPVILTMKKERAALVPEPIAQGIAGNTTDRDHSP